MKAYRYGVIKKEKRRITKKWNEFIRQAERENYHGIPRWRQLRKIKQERKRVYREQKNQKENPVG